MNVKNVIWASIVTTAISCQSVKKDALSFENYPVRQGELTEMEYSPAETKFALWSPMAEEVKVLLYESGHEGSAYQTLPMTKGEDGTWTAAVQEDLNGKFYTFNVKVDGKWLGDTPGIMAKAVGVNGRRAAILDLDTTDPEGWAEDVRPALDNFADVLKALMIRSPPMVSSMVASIPADCVSSRLSMQSVIQVRNSTNRTISTRE